MGLRESVINLAAGAPPELFPAREQMAVSLGWHIILACFGVAFPTMIFVMHRRGIRRNDLTALRLAKRWSKVSAVLFAIEIPANFERAVRRGDRPALLVAAYSEVVGSNVSVKWTCIAKLVSATLRTRSSTSWMLTSATFCGLR